MISDRELGELLNRPDEPEKIVHEIVHLAVRRGGPDNAGDGRGRLCRRGLKMPPTQSAVRCARRARTDNELFRFSLAQALVRRRPGRGSCAGSYAFCVAKKSDWMMPRILLGKIHLAAGRRTEARPLLAEALEPAVRPIPTKIPSAELRTRSGRVGRLRAQRSAQGWSRASPSSPAFRASSRVSPRGAAAARLRRAPRRSGAGINPFAFQCSPTSNPPRARNPVALPRDHALGSAGNNSITCRRAPSGRSARRWLWSGISATPAQAPEVAEEF